MEFTKEQIDIINATGNIKINAVAGSGKTTTILEYAKALSRDKKILYLAFNKSVKLEAAAKFLKHGLDNVKVETAHSIAYKQIILKYNYKVKTHGYKTNEIAELLNLTGNNEKHTEYIIANHINKFLTYFCNSDKQKVQDLNYLDVVSDKKVRAFVTQFYDYIEKKTRLLLSKMDRGEIEITHDFYLKKFQLSTPNLKYDYILFDEGQDASPAMLDVFFKQSAIKVIVGDTHQQIYGWRFAVNSLDKANFKTYYLSTSFRFTQAIANLAMEVLLWKKNIGNFTPNVIIGYGNTSNSKTKAVIARTNLGLLLKAIEYVIESHKVNHLYFEGNINSYTYADEGTSLYDVLNLYNKKHNRIKDKLIKQMKNLVELEQYIDKSGDVQLGMMVEIVRKYGNKIPEIIKEIKSKHVDNEHKLKAEIIFSTVHRCKGMEYDDVLLVNDFITQEKLEKINPESKKDALTISNLNEEINLLYVAITRTRNTIQIPEELMPFEFPPSSNIKIIPALKKEDNKSLNLQEPQLKSAGKTIKKDIVPLAFSLDKIREKHNDAYKFWTPEHDTELATMFCEGAKMKEMMIYFGRTRGAIKARIIKLDLVAKYA